jgi:glycosyltransferase involved in cell wall biosynthesis
MPRLLMVVFEFPPSNGASVQRIISFYNAYVKAGWVVDVLTVSEHNYEMLADTSSLLPNEGGKILRAGALDVQKDLSWRGKYLGPLMTPDRWGATWIPSAILKGVNHIRNHRPDLILSSAPIPSVNVIARVLSQSFGVKWIADYRDPMHYFHGSTNKRLNYIHEKIDKSVVENADALTFATSASQSLYIAHFADHNLVEKSIVIENGFSEDNFEKLPKECSSALCWCFIS